MNFASASPHAHSVAHCINFVVIFGAHTGPHWIGEREIAKTEPTQRQFHDRCIVTMVVFGEAMNRLP